MNRILATNSSKDTGHCVHEIITLAIRAQFAFPFRPTLLSNF